MIRTGHPQDQTSRTSWFGSHRRRWVALLGCGLVIAASLLAYRFVVMRASLRDSLAHGRLKQIALALHNYHHDFGRFPPAVVYDANGTALHSWRALISPYLDLSGHQKYDFGESWNSSANAQLRNATVACFTAQRNKEIVRGATNFVAVVGPGTIWDEKRPSRGRPATAEPLIMVVEFEQSDINWLEPRDISTTEIRSGLVARFNTDHVNFVTANGRIGTLFDNHIVIRNSEADLLRTWMGAEK